MDDAMSMLTAKDIRSLRRRYAAVPEALAWIDAQTPSIEPRRSAGTGTIRKGRGGIGRRVSLEAAAIELARQARDDARSIESPAAKTAPVRTNAAKPAAKPLETTEAKPAAKPASKRRSRKSSKPRPRKAAATRPLSTGELALAELRSRRGKHAATLS